MFSKISKILKLIILVKKFLEIDYPRSRAAKHYANFLALCATEISNYKRQFGNPGVELRGILMIKMKKKIFTIDEQRQNLHQFTKYDDPQSSSLRCYAVDSLR